jgi:hypothetical protein
VDLMHSLLPFMGARRTQQITKAIGSYDPKLRDANLKLSRVQVQEIRTLLVTGRKPKSIHEQYGISLWTVYDIKNNRSHRGVA